MRHLGSNIKTANSYTWSDAIKVASTSLIQWLQSHGNLFLDYFFMAASWMGTEEFYLLAIPLLYWYVSPSLGFSAGLLFCISMYVNSSLKDWLALPRPDPRQVRVLYAASGTGYGFPSGHAQSSVTFWGYLASRHPVAKMIGAAVILIFLISLSRLYLGLHFLRDVIGGVLIGLVILQAFLYVQRRVTPGRLTLFFQGSLILILSLIPLAGYREHAAWQLSGALLGMGWGHLLQQQYVLLEVRAGIWHQLLKGGLGIGVLASWYLLAKNWLPEGDIFTLIRYASLSLAGFFLLPLIFRKLKWENISGK